MQQKLLNFLVFIFLFCFQNTISSDEWKRVYLASYPRSGNHWLRFLIEEATGIATSSVYTDQEHPKPHLLQPFPWGAYSTAHGYYGNCRYPEQNDIVVIKTHFPLFTPLDSSFPHPARLKTIRIVRHPVDSFYSYLVYMGKPLKTRLPKEELLELIATWRRFEEYWNNQPNVITFVYEDIFASPFTNFKQILEAIGYNVPDENIKRAISKFPPQGGILKHVERFQPDELMVIKEQLNDIMQKYGYEIPEKYLEVQK